MSLPDFEIDWAKYPQLESAIQRSDAHLPFAELARLLREARADALVPRRPDGCTCPVVNPPTSFTVFGGHFGDCPVGQKLMREARWPCGRAKFPEAQQP